MGNSECFHQGSFLRIPKLLCFGLQRTSEHFTSRESVFRLLFTLRRFSLNYFSQTFNCYSSTLISYLSCTYRNSHVINHMCIKQRQLRLATQEWHLYIYHFLILLISVRLNISNYYHYNSIQSQGPHYSLQNNIN